MSVKSFSGNFCNYSSVLADENELRDMKQSQMNQETLRVEDLIADKRKMQKNEIIFRIKKEQLTNECKGKKLRYSGTLVVRTKYVDLIKEILGTSLLYFHLFPVSHYSEGT